MHENHKFITVALRILKPLLDAESKYPEAVDIIRRRLVYQAKEDQTSEDKFQRATHSNFYLASLGRVLYQDKLYKIAQELKGQTTCSEELEKAHLFMTQDFQPDFKTMIDGPIHIVKVIRSVDAIQNKFKDISFDRIIQKQPDYILSYQSYLSKHEQTEFKIEIKSKQEFVGLFIETLELNFTLQQLFKKTLSPLSSAINNPCQNFNIYDYDQELSIEKAIKNEVTYLLAFLKKYIHSIAELDKNSEISRNLIFEFIKFLEVGTLNFFTDFDKDFEKLTSPERRQLIKQVTEWQLMLINLSLQIDKLKSDGRIKEDELTSAIEVLMILQECQLPLLEKENFTMSMGTSKSFPLILSYIFDEGLEIAPRAIAMRKRMSDYYKLNFQAADSKAYKIHIDKAKEILSERRGTLSEKKSEIPMTNIGEQQKMSEAIKLLESASIRPGIRKSSIVTLTSPLTLLGSTKSTTVPVNSSLPPTEEAKNLQKDIDRLKNELKSVSVKMKACSESMLYKRAHIPVQTGSPKETSVYQERVAKAASGSVVRDTNLERFINQEEDITRRIHEKQERLKELQLTVSGPSLSS